MKTTAFGLNPRFRSAASVASSIPSAEGTLLFGNLNDCAPQTLVSPADGRRLPLDSPVNGSWVTKNSGYRFLSLNQGLPPGRILELTP
jgi:hypothetical protein